MKLKLLYLVISCQLVSCWAMSFPDPDAVRYDDKTFNSLAKDIISQNQIYQMDDFTRYHKKLNYVPVKLPGDQPIFVEDSMVRDLDFVTDSLKIDGRSVNDFRQRLEKTQLREFFKSSDSVLFIVDGIMSHSWGFFYCRRGLGTDSTEFAFCHHIIRSMRRINSNWAKASID